MLIIDSFPDAPSRLHSRAERKRGPWALDRNMGVLRWSNKRCRRTCKRGHRRRSKLASFRLPSHRCFCFVRLTGESGVSEQRRWEGRVSWGSSVTWPCRPIEQVADSYCLSRCWTASPRAGHLCRLLARECDGKRLCGLASLRGERREGGEGRETGQTGQERGRGPQAALARRPTCC